MSDLLETWFRAERDGPAPDVIARVVAARTRATRQRRRVVRLPGADAFDGPLRRMPFAPIAIVAVIGVLAVALLASVRGPFDGRNGIVAGPPSTAPTPIIASPSPTPGPSATDTLPPAGLRIEFRVADGVVPQMKALILHGTIGTPPPHSTGSGTYVMTGALSATGTFTDSITYATSGEFTVTRTLETPRGRWVAVATETLQESDSAALIVQGSWKTLDGTGAWGTVSARGTVSGSSTGPAGALPETWIGTVSR